MDDRTTQFRIGVVVVAAVIVTGILVMLFGDLPALTQQRYTVYVAFPTAPSVTVDTPVRKSGILIGRVTDVELREDGDVLVTCGIDSQYALRANEVCKISTGGSLLGDAVLEFVPTGVPDAPRDKLQDGDLIVGVVGANPLSALTVVVDLKNDIVSTLRAVERAGNQIGVLAANTNNVVTNNRDQLGRVMAKTERAIDSFQTAIGDIKAVVNEFEDALINVNSVLGDRQLQANLKQTAAQLPQVMSDTRNLLKGLENMSSEAAQNLKNLQGLTGPLGEKGPELIGSIEQTFRRLDQTLAEVQSFARSLNRSEGTLGQLVKNPELYDKLNRTVANIEELTRRLRPIMNDLRVFADKIARDPSRIGVGGALRGGRSGLK